MKSLIVHAYVKSERVAKEMLFYDEIPGSYQGCISLEETGEKGYAGIKESFAIMKK